MSRISTLLFCLAVCLVALTAAEAALAAPEIGRAALDQISVLMSEKAARTPVERKVSSALLLEHKRRLGDARLTALPQIRFGSGVEPDGRVLVDVDAEITERLLGRVAELDGRLVNAFPRFQAARVHLPLDRVLALAELDEVRGVRPADPMITQAVPLGPVVTEGDVAHGTNQLRANTGADGTGVRVGAMSDSVDQLGTIQAAGELPAVTVLPDQSGNPGTSEGTALLEIIHDMAPGAELFFATGIGGQAQMAQNILDLHAAGCDVIVDDVLYLSEPVFQDGIIAQAVDEVAAAGTYYFSSAGNSGNLTNGTSGVHEAEYSGIALPMVLNGAALSAHDFGDDTNATTVTFDPPSVITLQWANPQDAADDDYDLFLLDETLSTVLAASTNTQDGTQDPLEFIPSTVDDTDNKIVVTKFAGDDVFIHVNTHRGRIEHGTDGQIFGHPAALGALAVAAVDVATAGGGVFTGGPANPVEFFSSDGPRRIFFEPDGTPVGALDGESLGATSVVRQKPDVTSADGVSTTTMGFNPFFGTSASAPHTAAIGALFKDLFPSVSAPDAFDIFRSTALDIEDPGFDRDSGAGILNMDDVPPQPIFSDGFESGNTSSWTSN